MNKNTDGIKPRKTKKDRIFLLTETAVLLAIVLIMALTPIGYLKIGLLSISLITIPVAVGAMTVGWQCGSILGLAFGITSFVQCLGSDAFGTALFGISPVLTFIMCIPTRVLCGLFTALIYKALYKADKKRRFSPFVCGLLCALLNTVFFMIVLISGFYNSGYIQALKESMGAGSVFGFLTAMVGVNGIVEMISCCIAGGSVTKVLCRVIKKTSDGEHIKK